jgi:hypothetical protein
MKTHRLNFAGMPSRLARSLSAISSLLLLIPTFGSAGIVNVPSDIPPGEGNLNNAVEAAIAAGTLSNTVFELEPNGYYILTRTITVPAGEHLTIIVAPELGQTQETAPPQFVWSSNIELFKYSTMLDCYGDITLKNLWIRYANTEGQQIGANIQIQDDPEANASGKGEIGVFENVIFDYSATPPNASGAVGVTANHFKGTFKNCYFKNCIDPHFRYYGRAVSFPFNTTGWHIDSIVFENCTFSNIGYVYSQEGNSIDEGQYSDNVHFNHCTFFNVVMFTLESGWWYKMSVTNSIFVNTHMVGYFPEAHGDGECNGGTVRIDSIANFGFEVPFTEQDRRILFANNSYFIEEWLRDWMNNSCGPLCPRGTPIPQPQPMLNPGTIRFFESEDFPYMNMASLYDAHNPGLINPPTARDSLTQFLWCKWWSGCDYPWAWKPENSLNQIWPLEENLAYTNDTLLTAGMGGYPLGDLYRWFSEEYTKWNSQEAAEDARISHWLETGRDSVFVSEVQEPLADAIPSGYSLSQNHPNPFNPTTVVKYSVPHDGHISLKVYNFLGEEVATLFDGVRQPGNYEAIFDGQQLASGAYVYRLQSANVSISKKLVLMK